MKKPNLSIPTYKADVFQWSHCDAIIDASDLGIPAGKTPGERIWNDSADVGFWIEGRAETVLFVFSHIERDVDGDILGWRFIAQGRGYTCTIYND